MNKLTKPVIAFLGITMAMLLGGCATTGDYPAAPAKADIAGAPDYLIGAGDGLSIQVWRNPEVSTSVTVRPDGKFNSPLVDDIVA